MDDGTNIFLVNPEAECGSSDDDVIPRPPRPATDLDTPPPIKRIPSERGRCLARN